jgi:hypothetical protein
LCRCDPRSHELGIEALSHHRKPTKKTKPSENGDLIMKNEDLMGFIGGLLPMVIMANG